MEEIPTPKDLRGAAAVAQTLAYVTGIAGVVAGGILYRQGETAFAAVAWALTFAGGAILMIAAFVARAIAGLLARLARIEQDLAILIRDQARLEPEARPRDPWGPHQPPY